MLLAGVARTGLTPFWGVELAGWGYYIERRWQRVHDPLYATAIAADGRNGAAVLLALDLMVIDERFTQATRKRIQEATGLPPEAILLTCSHTHNAPAAGGLLGVGACDPYYEDWASRQAATAAILAWNAREPALVRCGHTELTATTYNRTRAGGPVDPHLAAARIDRTNGSPLAILVNFGAHPTVSTKLRPRDVGRDVPGEVCDLLEEFFPGSVAMYVQGACGDVNFLPEFQTAERMHEPAQRIVAGAIDVLESAPPMSERTVAANSTTAVLPTRRWTREELDQDRSEAARRLAAKDTSRWRESIGRAMTNRPEDMVDRHGGDEWKAVEAMCRFAMEWTDLMLRDYEARPETLRTEVQTLRIGDLYVTANSSEFFSPFALDVRRRAGAGELMIACYANGRIGYLPDEYDIAANSYAAYQSPKYCNQFPFTPASGPAMCEAMLASIERCRRA